MNSVKLVKCVQILLFLGFSGIIYAQTPKIGNDVFDFNSSSPEEFLEFLKKDIRTSLFGVVVPYMMREALPNDWIKPEHIPELINLIDSKEPCRPIMLTYSHMFPTKLSTIGDEAMFMIEGFRKNRYPSEPNSPTYSSKEKKEVLKWWNKWSKQNNLQIFPLPILDKLPSENRYFYPNWNKCCEAGEGIYQETVVENPHTIKLPNGFNLTISDLDSKNKPIDNQFSLYEDTVFVENRDGVKKAIAAGQGWGDPEVTLMLDNKNKRIYIRESQGVSPKWGELVTREYDLKCSNTECFFYQDRDCLLKIKNVDKPSKILKDLKKAAASVYDEFFDNVDNISIVFIPALSGKKENIELFFDIKKLGEYIPMDAGVGEIYSEDRRFLLEYGSKCFKNSGVDWNKYSREPEY